MMRSLRHGWYNIKELGLCLHGNLLILIVLVSSSFTKSPRCGLKRSAKVGGGSKLIA